MKCIIEDCEEPKYEYKAHGETAYGSRCASHVKEYHREYAKKNRRKISDIVTRYRNKKRAAGLPWY